MTNMRCYITRDGFVGLGWAEFYTSYAYTGAYAKNCYFVWVFFFLKDHTWSALIGKQGNPSTFLQFFKVKEQNTQQSFFPFSLLTLDFLLKFWYNIV